MFICLFFFALESIFAVPSSTLEAYNKLGPVDNKPSTNETHHFVKKKKL